ncbi:putative thimet oligopeptidase [Phaeomoniella chlamydospora]|uniref:Putative thimet oligopeptidase n=1 Tax=Phaeomoniella chlamydospora TaxID=158046 RepID=A0A0G2H7C8_PHACM|nr:putative thimet oligopeptidase [Phaeomoniella chlamydospora]
MEEIDGKYTGRIWITFRRFDLQRVLQFAKKWHVRREMWLAWENRYASTNMTLFRQAILLRDEAARLLGYPHNSALKVKEKMIEDVQVVKESLEKTQRQLTSTVQTELAVLRDLKAKHIAELGYDDDEKPDIYLTKYSKFHGTRVAQDFVEVPSMMLENFFWVEQNIQDISLHYSYLSSEFQAAWCELQKKNIKRGTQSEDTSDRLLPLPARQLSDETARNVVKSRYTLNGLRCLHQIFMAKFDQTVYSPLTHLELETLNLTETWNKTRKEITGLCGLEMEGRGWDWGHGYSRFRGTMGAQEAGYYTYLLSQDYSLDIWNTFFSKDPMSASEGRRYRHMIFEKGGSQDAWDVLTEYLGREPNPEAFEKHIAMSLANI